MNKQEWLQAHKAQLQKLYPSMIGVYGPYTNSKDGRARVVINLEGGKKITKQYAKIKMELKDKRVYGRDETVSHEDRNHGNDKFSNLKIRPRREHARLDVKRVVPVKAKCVGCETEFILSKDQRAKRSMNKAGPFCSKACSGRYGTTVQYGGKRLGRTKTSKRYAYASKEKWDAKHGE